MALPRRHSKQSRSNSVHLIDEAASDKRKSVLLPQNMLSKSISGLTFRKHTHDKADSLNSSLRDVSEQRVSEDEESDIGRSRYMMKSIVGLLTTASVYAGMQDAQEASKFGQDLPGSQQTKSKDEKGAEDDDEKKIESLEPPLKTAKEGDRKNEVNTVKAHCLETRQPTLFDFSVVANSQVPQLCQDSSIPKHQGQNILVNKLLKHFNLYHSDSVLKEFSAWILKDVLLQGKVFLTSRHLLFFAYLPRVSGTVKINGNLTIKTNLRGSTRYWCVLKDYTLSVYNSPSEVYFPVLTIDLRNALNIKVAKKGLNEELKHFKITTSEKSYTFMADSEHSAKAWTNALKKQLFAAKNSENNSVSLKIPLANIVDLDDQLIMKQTFTLRIKVLESPSTFAVDDFFFVFLDGSGSILKTSVIKQIAVLERAGVQNVYNSGQLNKKSESIEAQSIDESETPALSRQANSYDFSLGKTSTTSSKKDDLIKKNKGNRPWRRGLKKHNDDTKSKEKSLKDKPSEELSDVTESSLHITEEDVEKNGESKENESGSRKARIAGWTAKPFKHMAEMWSSNPIHYRNNRINFSDDDPYLIDDNSNVQANHRFREHFKMEGNELLIGAYFTYLTRNIPLYGKLYVAEGFLCFRTLVPRIHTKMILPLTDIETCYKEKGFRFGYFGLVIVIRGHEELFFEFSTEVSRGDLEFILLKRLDSMKSEKKNIRSPTTSLVETDTNRARLKFFEDKINSEGFDVPILIDENPFFQTNIVPNRSYKIGMLTIGSRGDVQPYVALGKGLLKEGHQVTIITHGEFREFVERHGIRFEEIAGNPAELMSLMVEHESMNVSLLRDASSHFREWITELLNSSWKVCSQLGLDLLIESPSAMAGIHIAEALEIPYFRAFTMPWTRTRAYPHAFIVPDQKRGGNYNYLTHVLFENIFWKGISGQVNKWRIESLGLQRTNLDLLQQGKVPFFYNVSPTIFPPSVDFSEWIKVTGYWFLDEKIDYNPPEELVDFIAKARSLGRKLVYIGFGSIVVSNAKEMTQAISDAAVEAGVYCVLNKGWSERLNDKNANEIEVELPECIYNAGNVPHDWLFPQMDAAVHHGGSGTTGASLRAGLPTVIKPFFGDQFFYALRVEDIGAGLALKHLNSSSLSTALKEVTTNKRMRDRASLIKEQISNENGVKTAINCLYGELVYAKSLVLSKRKKFHDADHSCPGKPASKVEHPQIDEAWTLL